MNSSEHEKLELIFEWNLLIL